MKRNSNSIDPEFKKGLTEDEINSPEFNPDDFAPAPENTQSTAVNDGLENKRNSIAFALVVAVLAILIGLIGWAVSASMEAYKENLTTREVLSVFPNCTRIEKYENEKEDYGDYDIYAVFYKERMAGFCVLGTCEGFGGEIRYAVAFNSDNTITRVAILEHNESKGLGSKIATDDFLRVFKGLLIGDVKFKMTEKDMISGATISTKAIENSIRDILGLRLTTDFIAGQFGSETITEEEIEEEIRKEEADKNNTSGKPDKNENGNSNKETGSIGDSTTNGNGKPGIGDYVGGENVNSGDEDSGLNIDGENETTIFDSETDESDVTTGPDDTSDTPEDTTGPADTTGEPDDTESPDTSAPETSGPDTSKPIDDTTTPEDVTTDAPDTTVPNAVYPTINSISPMSSSITDMGSAVYTVTAKGKGLTYSWSCSNPALIPYLSGTDTSVLTISINELLEGSVNATLTCTVTNSDGNSTVSDEVAFSYILTSAPKINYITPGAVTITESGSVNISVVAEGLELTYEWSCSDSLLLTYFSGTDTNTVTVTVSEPVSTYLSATIVCTVTDKYGRTATSEAAMFEYVPASAPPTITGISPESATITDTGNIVYSVVAEGSGLTYSWTCSNEALMPYVSGINTPELSVSVTEALEAELFASFTCTVTDEQGRTATSGAASFEYKLTQDSGDSGTDTDSVDSDVPDTEPGKADLEPIIDQINE